MLDAGQAKRVERRKRTSGTRIFYIFQCTECSGEIGVPKTDLGEHQGRCATCSRRINMRKHWEDLSRSSGYVPGAPCKEEGCDRKARARGYCKNHYRTVYRRNNPEFREKDRKYGRKRGELLNTRFYNLRRRAEIKQIAFDLDLTDLSGMLDQSCIYCGGRLTETGYNLDRKDSSQGYIKKNVVPCCRDCNFVKSDVLTFEEMRAAMKAVMELRNGGLST